MTKLFKKVLCTYYALSFSSVISLLEMSCGSVVNCSEDNQVETLEAVW